MLPRHERETARGAHLPGRRRIASFVSAEYVKGIALFIEVYDGHPNYDEAHLIAELSKRDTRWLGFSTQEARATFGWNLPKCVGKVLCDVHNTARRTKKLPPWAGQMG